MTVTDIEEARRRRREENRRQDDHRAMIAGVADGALAIEKSRQ